MIEAFPLSFWALSTCLVWWEGKRKRRQSRHVLIRCRSSLGGHLVYRLCAGKQPCILCSLHRKNHKFKPLCKDYNLTCLACVEDFTEAKKEEKRVARPFTTDPDFFQSHLKEYRPVDGQVHLVCSVHLQTDDFCLFFCQQADKRQTSVRTTSKW